jgi:hypothetical protein
MKPILFNTEMVQAILEGRKSVTRRLIKPQPDIDLLREQQVYAPVNQMHGLIKHIRYLTVQSYIKHQAPYHEGDILYVRETWNTHQEFYKNGAPVFEEPHYIYKADGVFMPHWKPSLHMPKEAARIFLRVKEIRVERLQDITSEQAKAEGVDLSSGTPFPRATARDCHGASNDLSMYQAKFVILWDSTIDMKEHWMDYSWSANPWIWVIEFEQISKEKAEGR